MNAEQEEVLANVWSAGDYCSECPYRYAECEDGFCQYFCEVDCAESCPGAHIEAGNLLDEIPSEQLAYLASYNPEDPEGLFFTGWVLKFGGTYAEAKATAARYYNLFKIWSLI